MPDVGTRKMTLTLPAALVPTFGTDTLQLFIVDDGKISGGKRAIQRAYRDSNASDAGRIRRIEWEVWGPIGASLFSTSGRLGVDFLQNLESRWERRLISTTLQTEVVLTGDDPASSAAYFGVPTYFGVPSYFGTAVGGEDVVVFDEQQGYLFAERGHISTQISLADWSLVESHVFGASIKDSTHWRQNGYLALGNAIPMQRRVAATPSGSTYEDVVDGSMADVYASAIKRGSDRAWYIDAGTGTFFNFAGYTLNKFVDLAIPFQVGDPDLAVNGIGPFGPLTMFGSADNIYSFTDQGRPIPLSKALDAIHSVQNGSQFADPGFGWLYYISVAGLRALSLDGNDNPIGVGERMRGFTGHNGVPTAIFPARGELWVVYQTTAGDLYGYRGVFGPETAQTGQPLFFPWFYQASASSTAIFSSTTPNVGTQELTIIRADGTNLRHMAIANNGRDDLDPDYLYAMDGGVGYLTTLDKDPNLLKTLRLVRVQTQGLGSGSSWNIAMGFDTDPVDPTGATYTSIGTVSTDGFQTVDPVSGAVPLSSISGRTIKPKVTQTAVATLTNSCANPSAEAGVTTHWNSTGSLHARTEDISGIPPLYGDYAFVVSSTGGLGPYANCAITLPSAGTYFIAMGVYIPSSYSGSDVFLSQDFISQTKAHADMSLRDEWQTLTLTITVTALQLSGGVQVQDTGAAAGATSIGFDGLLVVKSSTPVDYFDGGYSVATGSSAGCAWTGTTNLSTSTWNQAVLTPPELRGTLEIEYDERPEQIEEIEVVARLDGTPLTDSQLWDLLRQLTGSSTDGPFKIQLPDDMPPAVSAASGGGQKYAMLQSVTARTDINDSEIEAVSLHFECWPDATALS